MVCEQGPGLRLLRGISAQSGKRGLSLASGGRPGLAGASSLSRGSGSAVVLGCGLRLSVWPKVEKKSPRCGGGEETLF